MQCGGDDALDVSSIDFLLIPMTGKRARRWRWGPQCDHHDRRGRTKKIDIIKTFTKLNSTTVITIIKQAFQRESSIR